MPAKLNPLLSANSAWTRSVIPSPFTSEGRYPRMQIWIVSDLIADGLVDLTDMKYAENNAINTIQKVTHTSVK